MTHTKSALARARSAVWHNTPPGQYHLCRPVTADWQPHDVVALYPAVHATRERWGACLYLRDGRRVWVAAGTDWGQRYAGSWRPRKRNLSRLIGYGSPIVMSD